jgi:hypothetical protein
MQVLVITTAAWIAQATETDWFYQKHSRAF